MYVEFDETFASPITIIPSERTRVLQEWVDALNSGKYHQAQRSFHKSFFGFFPRWCAVGILYKLNGMVTRGLVWEQREWQYKLGIKELCDSVITQNDRGVSFAQIAAYIKTQI
jgi:hypothetical protein